MINKLMKEKKMDKVKEKKEENNGNAILQTFGGLLIAVGILDFALSWGGTNITAFLGPLSQFTPLAFGFIGAALLNAGTESGQEE